RPGEHHERCPGRPDRPGRRLLLVHRQQRPRLPGADGRGRQEDPVTATAPPRPRPPAGDLTAGGRERTRPLPVLAATAALLVAAYLSLGVGVADVGVADLLRPTAEQWHVLTVSRIPRTAAVLLAGAALSVAGLIM